MKTSGALTFRRFALASAALLVTACDSSTAPLRPAALAAVSAVEQTALAGSLVPEPPAVRVTGPAGQPVAGARVRFSVDSGDGTLDGALVATDAAGIARSAHWLLDVEPGFNAVVATVDGLSGVEVRFGALGAPPQCADLLALEMAPGAFVRATRSEGAFSCMWFDPGAAAGHQYLLLLENMPAHGAYDIALFPPSSTQPTSDTTLTFALRTVTASTASATGVSALVQHAVSAPAGALHSWDFGAGRIYEYEPPEPPGGVAPARLRTADGRLLDIASPAADPQVGDTIHNLRLEGIPRLGIPTSNNNRAVIRFVSDDLVIAEDVRLETSLVRENGARNTLLIDADVSAIAAEYAAHGRVQSDMLFDGRHNADTEAASRPRVFAIHSLMFNSNVWGYTYSATNYFVFDFWVTTDGSTRGLNQHPQRLADNLFMHEISHMRHWGMLQRSGQPVRGNRWLVEGFARFSERLPIAMRLLDTPAPSRTANAVLPRNPAFNNSFFRDDVPTFLNAGTAFGGGYQHSAYVFDYFADQVAFRGGDWVTAVREFVVAAGRRDMVDHVVAGWLPGWTFGELLTRARVALYTDDSGVALPPWTQYHQYQLRASRPPGTLEASDPRNAWARIAPGTAVHATGSVAAGGALGYVIDGTQAIGPALFLLDTPPGSSAILSITRIR
jgi:hypothetical protein